MTLPPRTAAAATTAMAASRPPHYVPESSVLLPTTEASNSDWPTFVLSDAIVYRPDGTTMANGLLINQIGPFTIRGRLEIDDDDDVSYLVDPRIRSAYIEIQDSKFYSIGYDPEAVIWLSGKAGWFEVNPHPAYARIYKDMCEAAQLDYVLAKIYEDELTFRADHKKTPPPKDIREVLFQYAVALGDGITYEETIDKCVRLGPALVAHMESSTGLPWKSTSIYAWLVRELKNRERSSRSSSRDAPHPLPANDQLPQTQPPLQSPGLAQQLPYRASPAVTATAATASSSSAYASPAPYTRTLSPDETEAVFQVFLRTVEDIGRRDNNQASLTAGKVHAMLHQLYKLREYNTGKLLSAVFADRLLQSLGPSWHGGPYMVYLRSPEAKAWLPSPSGSDEMLRYVPDQLVRRNTVVSRVGGAAASSLSPAGSPAPQSIPTNTPRPTAGKRAVLRPPVAAAAKKRPFDEGGGGGGGYESSSAPAPPHAPHAPRPVGRPRKTAKSTHEHVAAAWPGGAAAAQMPAVEDDHEDSDSTEDGDDDDDDDGDDVDDIDETVVAVQAVPLNVSTRPTGPNGTWTCPQPKCRFLVRNAGDPDSVDGQAARERIKAHLRSHEEEALSRVDLAIAEGSRKHVSVDNLLAKIRALADRKGESRPDGSMPAATVGVGTSSSSLRRFLF